MKYKLCPKCKVQLHWALANPKDPWDDERYICPKCDGTYNIEDTNSYLIVDILPCVSTQSRFVNVHDDCKCRAWLHFMKSYSTKRQPKGYKYAQSTMRTPTHKRAMRVNKRAARRWKLDED